jgi:hypothetical protein
MGARGSAWLERTADNREVLGSNPSGPICKNKPICYLYSDFLMGLLSNNSISKTLYWNVNR